MGINDLTFFDRSRDAAVATNFWANLRDWPTPPSFVALAFQNGLEYRNAAFRRLDGIGFFTCDRNLMSFRLVTVEFTRLECVIQAPISTRVSLVGDTARPGGLYSRFYHAFLFTIYITLMYSCLLLHIRSRHAQWLCHRLRRQC